MAPTPHSSRVTTWCSTKAQRWKFGWTAIFRFHNDREFQNHEEHEGSPSAFLGVFLWVAALGSTSARFPAKSVLKEGNNCCIGLSVAAISVWAKAVQT